MLICPSCSHENPDAQKFCGECGTKLEDTPVREERKVITALFCDLVGSTALGESMDHEDVARLLERYQSLCRARIESHGGVVEKFIGDAVVGVFGVPAAHEDDPERAVRAALRICEDVDASDFDIQVRIGVNTGEALVHLDVDPRAGVGFATGDTMNTTARLEAAAPVMGVVVGERTRAATLHAIAYAELDPIVAKGKAEPLPAWKALEPISRVTDERDRTPFVGRELELQVLTGLFERARTRPSTEFATIVADPGLGKSRLVRELGRHVDALPELVRWRVGRCLPYGDGIGFWALGEIVKAEAGILDTDDQPTLAVKLGIAVSEPDPQTKTWMIDRLAPLVGLETTTAAPEQQEAFTSWRRFLESLATQGPTVLVIEDLHWADVGFVEFLEHLAERTAGLPLLVVVTARPEVEERHPSWPPGRRSTLLALSPLGDADVEALVRTDLLEASEELIRIVLERAGGSPMYAEQLAAMRHESALPIAGGAINEALIPASVQALIAARIDALPPEHKRVLMEASVVGKTFWLGSVSSLGEHPELEDTLADLVRREFCRPVHPSTMEGDAEFSFWHALVRDVAYGELTKAERARMHAGTARWIADRSAGVTGEDAEIVIHHIDAALELAPAASGLDSDGLTELLADAILAAGSSAMRTHVPRVIPLMERLLSMIAATDERRTSASIMLAEALTAAGDTRAARSLFEELFEQSLAIGDMESAVAIAGRLDPVLQAAGEVDAWTGIIRDLRRRLGATPSPALAEVLAMEANDLLFRGELNDGIERARASISMAGRLRIAPPALALGALGDGQMQLGDLSGESAVRLGVERLLSEGRIEEALLFLFNLAMSLASENPSLALERFDEAIALAQGLGSESSLWGSRAGRLQMLCELGWFEEVLSEAESILAWATHAGDSWMTTLVWLSIAAVEIQRGGSRVDVDALADLVRGALPPHALEPVATLAHARGDELRAQALLTEAAASPARRQLPNIARHAVDFGLNDLAEELLARSGEDTSPVAEADRAAAAAALAESSGRITEAVSGYRSAVRSYEAHGRIVRKARCLQDLGRSLYALGDTDEGTRRLREARRLWLEMGAGLRIAEIDSLLSNPASNGGAA